MVDKKSIKALIKRTILRYYALRAAAYLYAQAGDSSLKDYFDDIDRQAATRLRERLSVRQVQDESGESWNDRTLNLAGLRSVLQRRRQAATRLCAAVLPRLVDPNSMEAQSRAPKPQSPGALERVCNLRAVRTRPPEGRSLSGVSFLSG